jgi:hypothetical protein
VLCPCSGTFSYYFLCSLSHASRPQADRFFVVGGNSKLLQGPESVTHLFSEVGMDYEVNKANEGRVGGANLRRRTGPVSLVEEVSVHCYVKRCDMVGIVVPNLSEEEADGPGPVDPPPLAPLPPVANQPLVSPSPPPPNPAPLLSQSAPLPSSAPSTSPAPMPVPSLPRLVARGLRAGDDDDLDFEQEPEDEEGDPRRRQANRSRKRMRREVDLLSSDATPVADAEGEVPEPTPIFTPLPGPPSSPTGTGSWAGLRNRRSSSLTLAISPSRGRATARSRR